jgi:hypothetical protein
MTVNDELGMWKEAVIAKFAKYYYRKGVGKI